MPLVGEIWRSIAGHPFYDVSNFGRVRTWKPPSPTASKRIFPKVMKARFRGNYQAVSLCQRGSKSISRYVHHLVLETFVGPCPNGMEACHGKGGRYDNSLGNLSWGYHSKNAGTDKGRDGIQNCLTEERVIQVIKLLKAGIKPRQVSRQLGICDDTIYNIRDGKSYPLVPR